MSAVYITPERYATIANLPVSLPEAELRRGAYIQLAVFKLAPTQKAAIRVLALTVTKILTPGVIPDNINSTFGLATVGIYGPINLIYGCMLCSPIVSVSVGGVGTAALNPYTNHVIDTPGVYVAAVFNNTGRTSDYAIDMSVCVTGVVKFFK
jgi:hypothetical protein